MRPLSSLGCFFACAVDGLLCLSGYGLGGLFCFFAYRFSGLLCFLTYCFESVFNRFACFLRPVLDVLNYTLLGSPVSANVATKAAIKLVIFMLPSSF